MRAMSIGELARSAQVPIDTVRYYEKQGLMPLVKRRASGYREYDADALRRLRFIRRAKALGFSLENIAELLALREQSGQGVRRVRAIAQRKLAEVEQKIDELQRMRKALSHLAAACPGQGRAEECPILRAFDNDEEAMQ